MIKRSGTLGFHYECIVGGRVVTESTLTDSTDPSSTTDGSAFTLKVLDPVEAAGSRYARLLLLHGPSDALKWRDATPSFRVFLSHGVFSSNFFNLGLFLGPTSFSGVPSLETNEQMQRGHHRGDLVPGSRGEGSRSYHHHGMRTHTLPGLTMHKTHTTWLQVHRRFRDFTELDDQIRAALQGHHLQSSLPRLPRKELKFLTDHTDPSFLNERRANLEVGIHLPTAVFLASLPHLGRYAFLDDIPCKVYIKRLIRVPHVLQVPCTLPFVGMDPLSPHFSPPRPFS